MHKRSLTCLDNSLKVKIITILCVTILKRVLNNIDPFIIIFINNFLFYSFICFDYDDDYDDDEHSIFKIFIYHISSHSLQIYH